MEDLLKLLGFGTPLIYAGTAYAFFHWLDENASDEAKAALARTMRLKDYKNEQVASALVEVFDRIYTYPLLRWRAFTRSALLTLAISSIFFFETRNSAFGKILEQEAQAIVVAKGYLALFLVNAISDYLSLFVIRPWLVRGGSRPASTLIIGTLLAALIVICGGIVARLFLAHALFSDIYHAVSSIPREDLPSLDDPPNKDLWPKALLLKDALLDLQIGATIPALAVLTWLPLFALGIGIFRLLTPLSWIVGRTQWFLTKRGEGASVKGDWIRGSRCCLRCHCCGASGLQRVDLGVPKSA
jgi:hypothetical protein